MKILMATMGMNIGGAETHILELSKELKHQGHDVIIVSNGGVYVPEIEAAGIRHYQAPMHRRGFREMRRSRTILRDIISRERPDVVHAHARIPAFLCGSLQKRMGFPFVTTAHWVFDTSGILRYLTNWGQRTVAVSEDIKEYLIREYGLPPEHISVTINGIDTEKFSPAVSGERVIREFGLDASRPVLSYVSRMDADRALVARQLIQIAPELDRAIPGIQLLIAGGGNVFDELKALAATGTGVAHCPISNMKLSSGVCRVPEMLRLGVPVGLAVDGAASNDGSNLLEELRVCYLLHRLQSSQNAPTGYDILKLATRGSARLLGRDDIGCLAAGMAADCFLISLDRIELAGAQFDPLSLLGTVGLKGPVDYTIVNGMAVVQNGELVTADEGELAARANAAVCRYLGRC